MYLTQEDELMLNGSIEIMGHLFDRLRDMPFEEATMDLSKLDKRKQERYKRKDRKDTRMFDILAEDSISIGDGFPGNMDHIQRVYNHTGVIITEECGRVPRETRIDHDTPTIISDPVDSSSYFDSVMKRLGGKGDRVGTVFDKEVERVGEAAARRRACNSSVTMIKDNMIKYTVVMNLFTGDVYVASPIGIVRGDIKSARSLADIKTPLEFVETESLNMMCYTRQKGKYEYNRNGTHLRFFSLDTFAKSSTGPAGPMRFAYIVKFNDERDGKVGLIAHNGEKIQESLPNIAVALYSKGKLQAYKLFCDVEYTAERGGKQLTPNLANSLYEGPIVNTGIKSSFLNNYDYPSEFRDTTAVTSATNDAAITVFTGMVARQYAVRIV